MNKSTLYFVVVILVVYFTLVFCDENTNSVENTTDAAAEGKYDLVDLVEEGRIRRKHFHGLHHMWGWHALAIAYFIKVKVVIVAFFIGAAVFWGLRYFWPHKCHSDIVHEGPVVFDHGPSFANHDHIPYSFEHSDHSDHSFDPSFDASSNFESTASGPYSGYGGPPYVETSPSTAPESHHVSRRSAPRQEYMVNEEQIAEFMFAFLGIDSKACRRRFICEVEFRSKRNPITSMAFRIVGRGFFEKYTNARNTVGHATSFLECATVNPDCTVIEQNIDDEVEEHEPEEAEEVESQGNDESNGNIDETNNVGELNANDVDSNKLNNDENATEKHQDSANEANLHAERVGMYKRHRRGQKSIDAVAANILSRSETNDTNK